MKGSILKRLEALEELRRAGLPQETLVIVETEQGKQEVTVTEYVEHAREMRFIRMGRGIDPTYSDIEKVLSVWNAEAMIRFDSTFA